MTEAGFAVVGAANRHDFRSVLGLLGGLMLVCVVRRGVWAGARGGRLAVVVATHSLQVLSLEAVTASSCWGHVRRSRGSDTLQRCRC